MLQTSVDKPQLHIQLCICNWNQSSEACSTGPCRKPGFDPWVGKFPWRRERLESHGQKSLRDQLSHPTDQVAGVNTGCLWSEWALGGQSHWQPKGGLGLVCKGCDFWLSFLALFTSLVIGWPHWLSISSFINDNTNTLSEWHI